VAGRTDVWRKCKNPAAPAVTDPHYETLSALLGIVTSVCRQGTAGADDHQAERQLSQITDRMRAK